MTKEGSCFLSLFVDNCQGNLCISSVFEYFLSAARVTVLEFESSKKFEFEEEEEEKKG